MKKGIVLLIAALCMTLFSHYSYAEEYNKRVIINQVYGTGNNQDVPVSHSFIELYNPTDKEIDLTGMTVQYAKKAGTSWTVYPLTGTIKAYSFFLIRGQQENSAESINGQYLKWIISDDMADMSISDLRIDNKLYKIAVADGAQALTVANPYGSADILDLLGVEDTASGIDAFEGKASLAKSSKQKSLRRVEFTDTDNNDTDFAVCDYRLDQDTIRTFAPRNSRCGNTLNGLPDPEYVAPSETDTLVPVITPTAAPAITPAITPTITPTAAPTGYTAKVILNQVYGTGNNQDIPVSHSFIELYNPTEKEIDLTGMSVQYAKKQGTAWTVYPLTGTIKAFSFYLIRGEQDNDSESVNASYLKWTVKDDMADADFPDMRIDNKLYKIAVVNGTEPLTTANPYGLPNVLDLLGTEDTLSGIDGYEGKANLAKSSKQKSLRRVDYMDTDNNDTDFVICDYRLDLDTIKTFAPRNSKCGDTLNGLPDAEYVQSAVTDTPTNEVVTPPQETETPGSSDTTPPALTPTPGNTPTPGITETETPAMTPTVMPTATNTLPSKPAAVYVLIKKVNINKPLGKYKAAKKVIVYAKANTKSKKLTRLLKGKWVSVMSVKGLYARVKINKKTGFIRMNNLNFSKTQNGSVNAVTYAYRYKSASKGTYKKLNKNVKLKIKSRESNFYKVMM